MPDSIPSSTCRVGVLELEAPDGELEVSPCLLAGQIASERPPIATKVRLVASGSKASPHPGVRAAVRAVTPARACPPVLRTSAAGGVHRWVADLGDADWAPRRASIRR